MNEALVTLQGWVGQEVSFRSTTRGNVANFRIGSTPRVRRSDGTWVDGPTSWFAVTCWRALAEHVRQSVHKGEPVLVHGRLRVDVWQREDGTQSVTPVVDALYVGHDLTRGTSSFLRASRPERLEVEDDTDPVVKELLHDQSAPMPQLTGFGVPQDTPAESGGDSRVA